jgi:hypothetical protein
VTIYPVTEAELDGWAWRYLVNQSVLPAIKRQHRVLTAQEKVTSEVSELWLKS